MRLLIHQPLFILLACFPLCIVVAGRWRPPREVAGRWLWLAVLFLWALGIVGPALSAVRHMIYHDEPTLISVAAAELHGQPLYHRPDAGLRYSLLYGPVTYWVYLPPMLAGVTDLRVYQLWVILPLLLAGLVMLRTVRRAYDVVGSAFALLPYAVMVVMQSPNEWAMKGDAWMLLFFSVELAAAFGSPAVAALWIVPLAATLLIHIKVTTFLLACVPLAVLRARFGTRRALFSSLVLTMLLPLPFLVPGVSASNFLFWIQASSRHGFDVHLIAGNAALVLFMALPAITLMVILRLSNRLEAVRLLRHHRVMVVCSIAASIIAIISGAKVGAGPWHCAPLAPLFAWITAELWSHLRNTCGSTFLADRRSRALLGAVIVSQFIVGGLSLRANIALHWRGNPAAPAPSGHLVAQDLISIVRAHPHTQVQMGYGGDTTYEMTWQRPVLVLLGSRYTLDADEMNESGFSHLPLPQAALDELRSCRSSLYLIPKGDAPFSMHSLYYIAGFSAPQNLFPEAFRAEFLQDYRKTASSRYFDLWNCTIPQDPPRSTP